MNIRTLVVRKDALSDTQLRERPAAPLDGGQVRVKVDSFALTSNNITYAAFGDVMNYWRFFPVTLPVAREDANGQGADDAAWGCIPVWGFGTVEESRHPDIPVGERLYGYYPMASHVVLTPARVSPLSFFDGAPHRAEMHALYNQYMRCSVDPFHADGTEDLQSLLRPLFTTSWLIDDFLADNDWFGAAAGGARPVLLLSSASSKTAWGTAFMLKQRGSVDVVGLTSERNVAYCESLGCYHRVLTYEQLDRIAADAPAIYVDFAGNAALRQALHTHCKGLVYSSSIGGTHVSELGGARDLPGPKPTLFFAPAQVKKRSADWGAPAFGQRLLASWQQLLATVGDEARPWLRVQQHTGDAAVQAAYAEVLAGRGDPRTGHVLSFD